MRRLLLVSTVALTFRAFLLPFARHYRRRGWRVDAAARGMSQTNLFPGEFDHCYELPLSRNPFDVLSLARAPKRIRRLVQEGSYDIVHVHTPVAALVTRFALRSRRGIRPKVVYTAHGFHFHRNGRSGANLAFALVEHVASGWCDALITINREDYEAARLLKFKTRVLWTPGIGIDTQEWKPSSVAASAIDECRDELRLDAQDVLFLMVAEFNPGKRHRDVIAALQKCTNERIHVAFAGEGPARVALEAMVDLCGLASRVHFLGYRRDIPALVRASRAVLLPSEREGLPRSLMEALSLEVPIIGADTRGISELAGEGCGLVHRVGDTAQLAGFLGRLASDPAEAAAMGSRGRVRMVAVYDESCILRAHDELYAELLDDAALERGDASPQNIT